MTLFKGKQHMLGSLLQLERRLIIVLRLQTCTRQREKQNVGGFGVNNSIDKLILMLLSNQIVVTKTQTY